MAAGGIARKKELRKKPIFFCQVDSSCDRFLVKMLVSSRVGFERARNRFLLKLLVSLSGGFLKRGRSATTPKRQSTSSTRGSMDTVVLGMDDCSIIHMHEEH